MTAEDSAAEKQEQQHQNQGPSREEFDALKAQVNAPMGVVETLFTHPFKHISKPGFGNKVEAGIGVAGRGAVGYGIYKGVRWVINKIWG